MVLVSALLVLAPLPTAASTFLDSDLPTLTRQSEAVVHGTVLAVDSYWNEDRNLILSTVTLEVAYLVHGKAPEIVQVRVPGGTVDGFTVKMEGGPRFVAGQEVVVFLDRWDDGAYRVAGYAMGTSWVRLKRPGIATLRGGLADGMGLSTFKAQVHAWARGPLHKEVLP